MLGNNLKIAFRNMFKNKSYSFLNLAGLSIGLAVCLLLSLWVKDELSYDQFHENSDQIYRSLWDAQYGESSWRIPEVPVPLAGMMEDEFPEVKMATQVFEGGFTLKKGEEYVREQNVLFTDEKFFEVFTINALAGVPKTAIQEPNTIFLTPKSAEKYFGKVNYQDLIGQNLERNDGQQMRIAGIVEGFPEQSHLQFEFLAPLKYLQYYERRKEEWGYASVLTYFLMDKKGNPANLDKKVQTYVNENIMDEEPLDSGNRGHFPFESIRDIHLKPNLSSIWIFGIIAAFILILACINFINLATARALTRAKEVGVRKVLGSSRAQLIQQFFSESTLYVLCSVVLAVLIAVTALPYFNELADKNLSLDFFSSSYIWAFLAALIFITAFATGTFPALALSSFSPTKVIKGQIANSRGKNRLRQSMVVFQFCVSCGLIIGTLVVNDQLNFLQNKELGFEEEQVLIIRRATALRDNFAPFLAKIKNNPKVAEVSTSQYLPGDEFDSTVFVPEQPSNYERTSLSYCHIDMNFVEALGLKMAEGRNYDADLATDSSAYLINERAAERLGWEDPIGKKLSYGGFAEGIVIGVAKDFNFASLHEEIEPLVMRIAKGRLPNIFVRLEVGNLREQLTGIQKEWEFFAPNAPFEFAFLDSEIQQLYESESRMSSIFTIFSLIAIFIACLGLFGLAAFMAQQRTKEIGVRKILGASITGLVSLLAKDFLKLVFIALLISIPISYYFMNQWLQNFAYAVQIQWWVFAITAGVAIGIALLTVSVQSIKAALVNPVKSLRNE